MGWDCLYLPVIRAGRRPQAISLLDAVDDLPKFIILSTQFLVFDTKFLVFKSKSIMFTHILGQGAAEDV